MSRRRRSYFASSRIFDVQIITAPRFERCIVHRPLAKEHANNFRQRPSKLTIPMNAPTSSPSAAPSRHCLVRRIVSGGQTGADRAALDWAIAHGVEHGGFCPRGRLAEDGPIPSRYTLVELATDSLPARTERNVVESDATLLLTMGPVLAGGSKLTAELAAGHGQPCLHAWAVAPRELTISAIRAFLADHKVAVLNVAGPRSSEEPEVEKFVGVVLSATLWVGPPA